MSDLKWTTEMPSKPGLYWYRLSTQDTNPAMAQVCESGGHLNAVWPNGKSVYVRDIPGEWAGPLELIWTKDKPTKPGWYSWRQDKEAKLCRVWEWWDKPELYVRFEGEDSVTVNTLEGAWAGPLKPPA